MMHVLNVFRILILGLSLGVGLMVVQEASAQTCGAGGVGACLPPDIACDGSTGDDPACTGGKTCCVPSGSGGPRDVCNFNGVCDTDIGENCANCPSDNCVCSGANACTSSGGTCTRIVDGCGEGQRDAGSAGCSAGSQTCCVPTGGACTAPGTCKAVCGATETDDNTRTCTGGQACCIPTPTPPGSLPPMVVTPVVLGLQNPLKFSSVNELVVALLTSLQTLIVTLALIMIIIGAFLYITSAGDDGRMETGKKTILAALIGLALGIAAPAFFKEIATILGWGNFSQPGFGTTLSLIEIGGKVLSFLLTIIGIIAIIMLVVGGFLYITSAGNEDQIDRGKKIVKYSLIGITVSLAALVLVKQVAGFFTP